MNKLARYRSDVGTALDSEFLSGHGSTEQLSQYVEPVVLDENVTTVDLSLVEDIIDHVLDRDLPKEALDGWLAPRIHSAMRIPRQLAADRGLWTWVAINVGNKYVRARWTDDKTGMVTPFRYTGTTMRNALARLWWGAELVRNGSDYNLVNIVFRRVRTAQWALELKYSWFRPATLAFVRMAEGQTPGMQRLSDDEMAALSKRINAYLTLTGLEAIAEWDGQDGLYDSDWRRHSPSLHELVAPELLEGPSDGAVAEEVIARLEEWFRRILELRSPPSR